MLPAAFFFLIQRARTEEFSNSLSMDQIIELTKGENWKFIEKYPLSFNTHHPQGLLKTGNSFILSTVSKQEQVGYLKLFSKNSEGRYVETLSRSFSQRDKNGQLYHLSGMDMSDDPHFFWVALSHYHSGGNTKVLKINKQTLEEDSFFNVNHHVGTLTWDSNSKILSLFDWGSKHLSKYEMNENGAIKPLSVQSTRGEHSFWKPWGYQDCKGLNSSLALCSSVRSYPFFRKSALDLISLKNKAPELLRRIKLPNVAAHSKRSALGQIFRPLAQNPFAFEHVQDDKGQEKVRAYFIPFDAPESYLFVYEVNIASPNRNIAVLSTESTLHPPVR